MKIKIYQIIVLVIVLSLAWFASVHSVKANAIDDKKKQIQDLQTQIQQTQSILSQKSEQVNTLQDQVAAMNTQIHQTELQIAQTQDQVDQTQLEINDLVTQIKLEESELKNKKAALDETTRMIYEMGTPSTIEIIIGSNSLSEIMDKTQYMDSINQKVQDQIKEINDIKAELEIKTAEQTQKKESLVALLGQQKDFQQGLADQKSSKDQLLSDTKGQEAQYQKTLAQIQAQWQQSNAELNQMEGGKISVSGAYSVVAWPIIGRLGVPFGAGGCQAYFCGKCHTGIDIIAPFNTPIQAAVSGTVIETVNSCANHIGLNVPWSMIICGGGYGNHVKIKSNDGYTQIYGHMTTGSVQVSVGQTVKAGKTVLGREGSTGSSTGYHLHFEIRNPSNTPVSPSLP